MSDDAFLLACSTAHLLHRAQGVAADRFARKPRAISLRQFAVLQAVAEQPGASQNDLARAASVDRSTLADMLKRLETLGLIAKATSATDARANAVQLTPLGETTLAEALDDARRADQAVIDAIPKPRRKGFQETLLKLADALDKAAAEADRDERKRRKRELKRARRLAEPSTKKKKKTGKASKPAKVIV